MRTCSGNPDSEENQEMTKQNEREIFALNMQAPPRPEGEPGTLWLHYRDGSQIPFSAAAAETISDVLRAYVPEHSLRKRVEQYQFCINRVAEALGNVCCGGVDSSHEDQMADPHSTTRVLVDAIGKLQQQIKDAQDLISAADEKDFLDSLKKRDGL